MKSAPALAYYPKTDFVVRVVAGFVVAVSRAAIIGIIVPGAAAQSGSSTPSLASFKK